MRLNIFAPRPRTTHEGATAAVLTAEQALRRAVLSCLLFEQEGLNEATSRHVPKKHNKDSLLRHFGQPPSLAGSIWKVAQLGSIGTDCDHCRWHGGWHAWPGECCSNLKLKRI